MKTSQLNDRCEEILDTVWECEANWRVMGSKHPDFKDQVGQARWIAETFHAPMLMVEGAGHYPRAAKPDAVGPEIVHFLLARSGRAA